MKILYKYMMRVLMATVLLLYGCVNDDSFFPDENPDTVISSIGIVTILQNFGRDNNTIREENQCFRFIYPIVLGYNTDATIRVDSYNGLLEILKSQGSNFNISGVQFPVQVVFKGSDTLITIMDENALLSSLLDCEFSSLRQDFDQFNNSCFQVKYPLILFSKEGNEVELNTNEEFRTFFAEQGTAYQPNFKFPWFLMKGPNFDSEIKIQTYYGLYRVLESCSTPCPDIDIADEVLNNLTLDYLFFATSTDPDSKQYSWFVNEELITSDVGDQFQYQFPAPGRYKVCATIETPECPNGKEECIDIEVFTKCPDLGFVWERLPGSFEHRFTANFDRKEDVVYQWFIDDEFIEEDGGPNGDNVMSKVLEPDSRVVCIKAIIPSCPGETLEFCETILIEQDCPDLFFTAEQRGDTTTYDFLAEFAGIDTVQYSWFVDDAFVENDGGTGADNTLVQEFEPGTHQVCIKTETPGCFFAVEYCEEIVIP